MRIVDTRKSITTLIAALVVIFLFGIAIGLVEVFVGMAFHLDEWARGWLGGMIGGSLLWFLIKGPPGSKRGRS